MESTAYFINGYSINLDAFGETWEVRNVKGRVVYYTRSRRLAEWFAREN
jgi:hypothetical protein